MPLTQERHLRLISHHLNVLAHLQNWKKKTGFHCAVTVDCWPDSLADKRNFSHTQRWALVTQDLHKTVELCDEQLGKRHIDS